MSILMLVDHVEALTVVVQIQTHCSDRQGLPIDNDDTMHGDNDNLNETGRSVGRHVAGLSARNPCDGRCRAASSLCHELEP